MTACGPHRVKSSRHPAPLPPPPAPAMAEGAHWVHFSRRLLWSAGDHPLAAPGGSLLPAAGAAARRLLAENAHSLSAGETAGYIILCVFLVIFAGMMAGLTLGLLSLDK